MHVNGHLDAVFVLLESARLRCGKFPDLFQSAEFAIPYVAPTSSASGRSPHIQPPGIDLDIILKNLSSIFHMFFEMLNIFARKSII
jgi:hypothetical protein